MLLSSVTECSDADDRAAHTAAISKRVKEGPTDAQRQRDRPPPRTTDEGRRSPSTFTGAKALDVKSADLRKSDPRRGDRRRSAGARRNKSRQPCPELNSICRASAVEGGAPLTMHPQELFESRRSIIGSCTP